MTIIRRVLFVVALVAWNASLASAQNTPCNASQFDTLTNMWKLEPDQNTRQIPAGELAAERKVMQRVVEQAQACGRGVSERHGEWGAPSREHRKAPRDRPRQSSRVSIDGEVDRVR
jgi:hypothetical protein